MKTTLLALIIVALSTANANAQRVKSFTLSGGVVSANNIRKINDNWSSAVDGPIYGWGIEAGAGLWAGKRLSFSVNAGYIQKGYMYKSPFTTSSQPQGTGQTLEIFTRLNYIYLAPRITYTYKIKRNSFFVFAAPRADYFVSAKETWYKNDLEFYKDEKGRNGTIDFYNNNHKPIVVGLTGGFGVERRVYKNIAIALELAYWGDITKAVNIPKSANQQKYTEVNRAVTAWITFKHYFTKD